jgi:hypothetical protein
VTRRNLLSSLKDSRGETRTEKRRLGKLPLGNFTYTKEFSRHHVMKMPASLSGQVPAPTARMHSRQMQRETGNDPDSNRGQSGWGEIKHAEKNIEDSATRIALSNVHGRTKIYIVISFSITNFMR